MKLTVAEIGNQLGSTNDGVDLISLARAGDGRAYRALVEPHLPMLYRIAARACGNADLAEDAVQETLTLAFRRLDTYRPEAPFKSYLAAIAVRQARTLARSERRRLRREATSHEPAQLPTPDEYLSGASLANRVRKVLSQMPRKRREAAVLRLDAGLSYDEIAKALGTSAGSARVLVHMAQKELRAALSETANPSETQS